MARGAGHSKRPWWGITNLIDCARRFDTMKILYFQGLGVMDNTAYPRRRYERDYRREIRQDRRARRSRRLQNRYNFRGVLGSFALVLLCLAAGVAIWFVFNLIIQFFLFLSNVNLKEVA